MHSKIDKGPKNTDQICCINPFWKNFLFILSSGTVFGDSFYMYYVLLNIFIIHVPIKKLEFKCDGSLHSIFCRYLQTFVNHKIWTLRRFFYKVKLFYMDCIVNKYIFFNLYVHSHLKYAHLIKSSLKYISNIVKYLILAMLSEELVIKYELENEKQFCRPASDS